MAQLRVVQANWFFEGAYPSLRSGQVGSIRNDALVMASTSWKRRPSKVPSKLGVNRRDKTAAL